VGGWSASQLAAAGITGTPKIVEGTLTIDTVPSVTTKTAPTATIGAKLGAAGVLAKGVAPKVSTGDGNIISSLTASDQTMIDEAYVMMGFAQELVVLRSILIGSKRGTPQNTEPLVFQRYHHRVCLRWVSL
jgi:hypothetical protein